MTAIIITTHCDALVGLFRYINEENQDVPMTNKVRMELIQDVNLLLNNTLFDGWDIVLEQNDEKLTELVVEVIQQLHHVLDGFSFEKEIHGIVPYDIVGSVVLIITPK